MTSTTKSGEIGLVLGLGLLMPDQGERAEQEHGGDTCSDRGFGEGHVDRVHHDEEAGGHEQL